MDKTKDCICQSGAGYYMGSMCWDEGSKYWGPNDRYSSYFYSKWEVFLAFKREYDLKMTPDEAIKEIDSEMEKAKGNKHKLIKKRIEFLNTCKAAIARKVQPKVIWNYDSGAKPGNAIIALS